MTVLDTATDADFAWETLDSASWRPRCSPRSPRVTTRKYVVVMMIPSSGCGADVSALAVRQIWDGICGLQGQKAALPGGRLPGQPHISPAGQMIPSAREG
jgi:hypothetical protein